MQQIRTIHYLLSTNDADSVIMPQSTFRMNRYMYVEGIYREPSGHRKIGAQEGALLVYSIYECTQNAKSF